MLGAGVAMETLVMAALKIVGSQLRYVPGHVSSLVFPLITCTFSSVKCTQSLMLQLIFCTAMLVLV